MSDLRRGLIIVNTGPGKGKTTAAMGTALRAVGQGMRVLMLQFLKGSWHYGELDAVKAFGDKFILKQMGRGFVKVGAEKPEMVHVILTGRNAHPTIVELADTVTEMRQVKHAYEKGVMAQRGIEY